jgi:hypothetical protein
MLEPKVQAAKMDTNDPAFILPNAERPDPNLAKLRSDIEEPRRRKSTTESELPKRTKLLTEIEEPTVNASRIDNRDATLQSPSTLNPLPRWLKLRSERLDPNEKKSTTETAEPIRAKLLILQEEPRFTTSSTLN